MSWTIVPDAGTLHVRAVLRGRSEINEVVEALLTYLDMENSKNDRPKFDLRPGTAANIGSSTGTSAARSDEQRSAEASEACGSAKQALDAHFAARAEESATVSTSPAVTQIDSSAPSE